MRRMYSLNQLEQIANNRVKTLVEGGTLNNAKPIYCHPVNIGYIDESNEFMITMLIFNNDATEFTFETFNAWLSALVNQIAQARIMASGYIKVSGTIYPVSQLYGSDNNRNVICSPNAISGILISYSKAEWEALVPNVFQDAVNKIN